MNETITHRTPTTDLPPILPPPAAGPQGSTQARPGGLGRLYALARRLPPRPRDRAVLGGVCAGVGERLGVSAAAVRVAAVVSVLALGVGVSVYLIAWTLMPDATGRTHLEQGLRHGRGRSRVMLVLGAVSALGVLVSGLSVLSSMLPGLLSLAALGLVGCLICSGLSGRTRTP